MHCINRCEKWYFSIKMDSMSSKPSSSRRKPAHTAIPAFALYGEDATSDKEVLHI